MNRSGSDPGTNPIASLRRVLFALLAWCAIAGAPAPAHEPDNAGWSLIERFPASIRFVGVVDEPSRFLLSGEGRAARALAASTGVLEHTTRAWEGLAAFYGTGPDGVISALLSGRVALAVDWGGVPASGDPRGMVSAADASWVLVARVDGGARETLSTRLEPVPRRIVRGVPVYTIEKGRFSLVMLAPHRDGDATLVMIAPMRADAMLESVLGAFRDAEPLRARHTPTLDGSCAHLIAARIRIDDAFPDPSGADGAPVHLRVALGAGERELVASFALVPPVSIPSGRAPVELLDAVGDDAVGAVAGSTVLRLAPGESGLPIIRFGLAQHGEETPGPIGDPGGVFLAAWAHGGKPAIGIMTRSTRGSIEPEDTDAWMRRVIGAHLNAREAGSGDPVPDYAGRFPGAIRSVVDPDPPERAPGLWSPSAVSWKTNPGVDSSDVVIALASTPDASARRVEELTRAGAVSRLLDPDPARSSVLTRGWVDPVGIVRLFDPARAGVLRLLEDKLGLLSWRVAETDGVVGGRLRLGLSGEPPGASIGVPADRGTR